MSPIEQKLWDAMKECWGRSSTIRMSPAQHTTLADLSEWCDAVQSEGTIAVCAPQVLHDPYCIDFGVVALGDHSHVRIAIECDGHDFHERTKLQAMRDRSRDRTLVADGVTVVRFTGAEIWRNPNGCVAEVTRITASELQRQCEIRHIGKGVGNAS
tara:strand:- start:671 stop:1138 length:468 start_codon:yes stop_codon:yes gene_type:complete